MTRRFRQNVLQPWSAKEPRYKKGADRSSAHGAGNHVAFFLALRRNGRALRLNTTAAASMLPVSELTCRAGRPTAYCLVHMLLRCRRAHQKPTVLGSVAALRWVLSRASERPISRDCWLPLAGWLLVCHRSLVHRIQPTVWQHPFHAWRHGIADVSIRVEQGCE